MNVHFLRRDVALRYSRTVASFLLWLYSRAALRRGWKVFDTAL